MSDTAAIGVSLSTTAGSGKDATSIVFQTHFSSELSQGEINEKLDKFAAVLNRQRMIGEIPKFQEDIKRCKVSIHNIESDTERLDKQAQKDWEESGRSGIVVLSEANERARQGVAVDLKQWKQRLADAEGALATALNLLDETKCKAANAA